MSTLTGSLPVRRPGPSTGGHATVELAGITWPVYKLLAVIVAAVVGVAVLVIATPQAAAWASAVALLVCWWGGRLAIHRPAG
ncbi:MAG: hypothetical protein QM662_00965 [Gordonia sp. (in: high G+C Gram-positive bacteria)]